MLRHLVVLAALVLLCVNIIHALPLEVGPAQASNVDVEKTSEGADDLDTAASSWGGYGIRGWFGPSYYGGGWGGRGHYGGGWGNRGHYGGGWGGHNNYGGGWGRGYGYGSGWNNGYRGGWW